MCPKKDNIWEKDMCFVCLVLPFLFFRHKETLFDGFPNAFATGPEPPLLNLQGAPSVRVAERPVQRSVSAAPTHHRALPSPSNTGTLPPSPRLQGWGGCTGGGRPGSGPREPESRAAECGPKQLKDGGEGHPPEGEPGGEETTSESPEWSDAGSQRQMKRWTQRILQYFIVTACAYM